MLLLYASKDCASRVESLHKAWPTVLVGVIFSSPGQTYAAERFSVICVALVSAAVGPAACFADDGYPNAIFRWNRSCP
jgi:hypothetical protein